MMVDAARPHDARTSPAAVAAFFALTFAWSWGFWLLAPLLKARAPAAATALVLVGGFGPSLAAAAVVAWKGGRPGLRRWLERCLPWRAGGRWMVVAFVFPVALMGLAAAAHVALGGTLPATRAADHLLLTGVNFVLVLLVGGPLGEEFGWRGWALPALQRRWGWRITSLVLGGVWALWHLPLFYDPGAVQSHLPMGWYALSAVASSVLFAWLFNRTGGSVLPVLVLHTAVNAWSSVIPVMVQADGSNLRPFQLVVGLLVVVALLLLLRRDPGPKAATAANQARP